MSIDSLKELSVSFQSARKKFLDEAKEALTPALQSIFQKHPEILKYGWTQYIPYFNDGEPCEFRKLDMQFITGYIGGEEDIDEEDMDEWDYLWSETAKKFPELSELDDLLEKNEELIQGVFGDHAKVIVTREGVEVLDYSDHD